MHMATTPHCDRRVRMAGTAAKEEGGFGPLWVSGGARVQGFNVVVARKTGLGVEELGVSFIVKAILTGYTALSRAI